MFEMLLDEIQNVRIPNITASKDYDRLLKIFDKPVKVVKIKKTRNLNKVCNFIDDEIIHENKQVIRTDEKVERDKLIDCKANKNIINTNINMDTQTIKKTILDFITKSRTPFIHTKITLNHDVVDKDGLPKKEYQGLKKNYSDMTYDESLKLMNERIQKKNDFHNRYNTVLMHIPSNNIVFDTDNEFMYNYILNLTKENNLYEDTNISTSFRGRTLNKPYKKHFYYKVLPEDTTKLTELFNCSGKLQFDGLDIIHNGWGISEILENDINYDNLQVMNINIIEDIITYTRMHQKKVCKDKTLSSSSNNEIFNNFTTTKLEEEIIKLLKILGTHRYLYKNWFNVLMICKNEGCSIEIFKEWSKCSDCYDETEIIQRWNSVQENHNNPIKIGSLKEMAKEDNPEEYFKIYRSDDISMYLNINTKDMADKFKELYSDKFIAQNERMYFYNGTYWEGEGYKSNKAIINNFISNKFFDSIYKDLMNIEKERLEKTKDNDERTKIIKDIIICKKNIRRLLLNHNSRQEFIKELFCVLNDNEIKFNEQPYLFCFNNAIFDLRLGERVQPKPDYYISMTAGYNYEEDKEDERKIKEIDELINTIHKDELIKLAYLVLLATGLSGIRLEKFIIANGSGANGKGVLNELMKAAVGNYGYKLTSTVITSPLKIGSNPEVANMNFKRFVIISEVPSNVKFNMATIKELTGGKHFNARLNFSNDTEIRLQQTMFTETNEKPK